jgi:hypothetical protein
MQDDNRNSAGSKKNPDPVETETGFALLVDVPYFSYNI